MVQKIIYGLIIITALAGCAHVKTIPIPTDEWSYEDATQEDGDYKLQVFVQHRKYAKFGPYDFYFKKYELDEFDDGKLRLSKQTDSIRGCGDDFSLGWSYGIDTLTQAGVVLDYSQDLMSTEINYDFSHAVLIPFKQSGLFTVADVDYSWEWIKLNPNQSTHSITASGGSE